jgi:TolB-like protein
LNRALIALLSLAIILLLYNQFGKAVPGDPADSGTITREEPVAASIAVLPFKNYSGDPALEYVSDGMADEIASKLNRIEAMEKVVPFVDMLKFKKADISLRAICDTLQVRYILDGSVQISGNQIRVKVQLLNGQTNDYVWSDDFTGNWNTNDLFAIQSRVAENVLKRLTNDLDIEEKSYLDYMSTENMEAYTFYLKGIHQANKGSSDGIKQAITHFQSAVELDPDFVQAWWILGDAWMNSGLYWGIYPEQQAWKNARDAYQQVLTKASGSTQYLKDLIEVDLLWFSYLYDWNLKDLDQAYLKGVEDTSLKTLFEIHTGRYEEALKTNENLTRYFTDQGEIPFGRTIGYRAMALYYLGRYAEAKQKLHEYEDLLWDDASYLMESAKWYYYLGAYPESRRSLEEMRNEYREISPFVWFLTAVYAYEDSNTAELENALSELQGIYQARQSGSPAWHLALYYAHTGDYERCLNWLQRSFERHEVEMIWLRAEPLLEPVRNDSRYLNIYKQVGFPVPPLSTPENTGRSVG